MKVSASFRTLSLALLLLVAVTCLASAEGKLPEKKPEIRSKGQPRLNLDYFLGYLRHTRSIVTSPSSWSRSSWLTFIGFAAITTAIASEEDDFQKWIQRNRTSTTDEIAKAVKQMGNMRITLGSMAGLYCYGRAFKDERARATSLIAIESIAITALFTETIKHMTHKHRPHGTDLEDPRWDGPSLKKENLSFPSGHAAHSFAIATVLASSYGKRRFVPPLVYGAAILCSLSRLNDNQHWISDVIFGAAVGHFTAKAVLRLHETQGCALTIVPSVGNGLGVAVSYRF